MPRVVVFVYECESILEADKAYEAHFKSKVEKSAWIGCVVDRVEVNNG